MRAVFALLLVSAAYAAIVGVDLGSEFIKIGASKGNSSIDIVLNEQTRRKSNNFIGFRGTERFFGEDARNFAARFPQNMLAMLNRLLGVKATDETVGWFKNDMFMTYNLTENTERGTVSVTLGGNPASTHSMEELVAMQFGHFRDFTEKDIQAKASDLVVVVPSFYSQLQRQALVDAAELAGFRVHALMQSTTATALYYGISRRGFGNDTVHVMIYDMGSSKTEVGVYTFSPTPPPKEGRTKLADSLGVMTTRFIASDPFLGGRSFDACIAKMIEDEFVEKANLGRVLGATSPNAAKAVFSLMRAANGAKEALCVNRVVPVTAEGMAPERDYSTKISREQFDTTCGPLFDRAVNLIDVALKGANLTLEDLASMELMGGGTRPPRLIEKFTEKLGKPPGRTLNTDESAALGATYQAARLSGHFRIKSFRVIDYLQSGISFVVDPPPPSGVATERVLSEKPTKIGMRKSVSLSRTGDFQLRVSIDGELHAIVNVSGVNDTLTQLGYNTPKVVHENNTQVTRIELKVNEHGIFGIEEAEIKYNYVANISRKVKVNATSDEKPNASSDEKPNATDADAAEKPLEGANETEEVANETSREAEPKLVTVNKYSLEMRKKTLPVDAQLVWAGTKPLTTEQKVEVRSVLNALDRADEEKKAIAAAKNDLETYIIWTKNEGVLENAELKELNFINDTEAEAIAEAAKVAQEWLEDGEGSYDSATKEQFREQLGALKNATKTVLSRYKAHIEYLQEVRRNATKASEKAKKEKDTKSKSSKPSKKNTEEAKPASDDAAPQGDDAAADDEKPTPRDDSEKSTREDSEKSAPREEASDDASSESAPSEPAESTEDKEL